MTWQDHKKLVVLNFKNNWIERPEVYQPFLEHSDYECLLAPPVPLTGLWGSQIGLKHLIAQTADDVPLGAYTGAVGLSLLKEMGVSTIMVGHPETRAQGQSPLQIQNIVYDARKQGLRVVLCCSLQGRDFLESATLLGHELSFLMNIDLNGVIIAFEPVWAIGGVTPASLGFVYDVCLFLKEKFPGIKVLYGGGLSLETAREFLRAPFLSGLLLGRMALDVAKMTVLLENYHEIVN